MPRYIVQVPGKKFGGDGEAPVGADVTAELEGNVHATRALIAAGWVSVLPDLPLAQGEVDPPPVVAEVPARPIATAVIAPDLAPEPLPPVPQSQPEQEESTDGREEPAPPAVRPERPGRGRAGR